MSDNESAAANDSTATQFNEREFQFLAWAMQSAKNGPPEVCSYPVLKAVFPDTIRLTT